MASNEVLLLFAAVVIVIVAVVVVIGEILARKRTAALQTASQEISFSFVGNTWSQEPYAPRIGTALFGRGRRPRFANIMTGTMSGLQTKVFDYSYTVGSARSSSTHTQTVAAYSQVLWLPHFELRPEGFFDRVGEAFVRLDINFDSFPEFSRRYFLRGTDEDGIRKFFSPALITFLEQLPADEKWHVEGDLTTLVIYRSDATVSPDDLRAFLDKTAAIAAEFFRSPGMMKPVH